tara:strand:- start:47 stop:1606 length:1560 start_codon:yes stop_codon:yes gene_type:complete
MPTFEITAPNGEKYEVTGKNAEGAYAALRKSLAGAKPVDEIDTPLEYAKDIGGAALAGAGRGLMGTLELPEMAARGVARLGQEGLQALGYDVGEDIAVMDTGTGRGLDRVAEAIGIDDELDYRGQTRAGKFAGTIGEFTGGGGAVGLGGKLLKGGAKLAGASGGKVARAGDVLDKAGLSSRSLGAGAVAGVGSEAAGQLTEGKSAEPYARIAGALIAPYSANKTLSALQKRNVKSPTIATLQAEKNTAYDLLKTEGAGLTGTQTAYLMDDMRNTLNVNDIVLSAKPSVEKALKLVDEVEVAGSMSLAKFNELQKALGKIYRSAPDAPEVLSMVKKMDDALAEGSNDAALMLAAKAANAKYSKAKMLDRYFSQAVEGKSSKFSNSGQALQATAARILKNDKALSFWSNDELTALKSLSDGSIGTRTLRTIGALSPTSGGVSAGFNVALALATPGVAFEIMGITATTFAKMSYNAKIKAARKGLEDLVRSGGVADPSKVVTKELVQDMLFRMGGINAMEQQ